MLRSLVLTALLLAVPAAGGLPLSASPPEAPPSAPPPGEDEKAAWRALAAGNLAWLRDRLDAAGSPWEAHVDEVRQASAMAAARGLDLATLDHGLVADHDPAPDHDPVRDPDLDAALGDRRGLPAASRGTWDDALPGETWQLCGPWGPAPRFGDCTPADVAVPMASDCIGVHDFGQFPTFVPGEAAVTYRDVDVLAVTAHQLGLTPYHLAGVDGTTVGASCLFVNTSWAVMGLNLGALVRNPDP